MLGFEVSKERMDSERKSAVVPDIVVADRGGTYLVGEVKHWYINDLQKHIGQIQGYQRALEAPRAFLTNGHRWMIFDLENEKPALDKDFTDCREMIEGLRQWVGRTAIRKSAPFPYRNAYEIGLSMGRVTTTRIENKIEQGGNGPVSAPVSPTWVADSYKDATVRQFIQELKNLANEYSYRIRRDEGQTGLMLKDLVGNKKLIEYWPNSNRIYKTVVDHKSAGVPHALSDEYHAAVTREGNPVNEPKVFTELLRKIIESLDKG